VGRGEEDWLLKEKYAKEITRSCAMKMCSKGQKIAWADWANELIRGLSRTPRGKKGAKSSPSYRTWS